MPRIIDPSLYTYTFNAEEALDAHVLVIQGATDGGVQLPGAAPDTQVIGVTIAAAASGEDVDVCMFGPCLLRVDGNAANIAVGDWLEVHATTGYGGKRALSDGTTFRELVGWALEASTADADEIAIFFTKVPTATA